MAAGLRWHRRRNCRAWMTNGRICFVSAPACPPVRPPAHPSVLPLARPSAFPPWWQASLWLCSHRLVDVVRRCSDENWWNYSIAVDKTYLLPSWGNYWVHWSSPWYVRASVLSLVRWGQSRLAGTFLRDTPDPRLAQIRWWLGKSLFLSCALAMFVALLPVIAEAS